MIGATIAALDESFFRVRFDRLTPLEKKSYWLPDPSELGGPPVVVMEAAENVGVRGSIGASDRITRPEDQCPTTSDK